MEKKKSVLLLISAILGCAYLIYSIVYWTGLNSGGSSSAESIGFGIATAIVFPHLIATAIAVIFNLLGWVMDHKWFALTGAIMYTMAMILFPLYFMFVVTEMILSYIGFARMIGREKQAWQVRPQQPAPRMTENALGDLDSKKLVHAAAMVRYCKHFGFDNGLSDTACENLFSKAERCVAPDTEVVMAFIAQYPADTEAPCACAFAVHKLIVAAQDNVLKLPTDRIEEISLSGDAKKVIIQCGGINYDLGVDAHQVNSILDFLRRSKDACMEDIKAESLVATGPRETPLPPKTNDHTVPISSNIGPQTCTTEIEPAPSVKPIKTHFLPTRVDGHPIQYAYIRDITPKDGIDIAKDILAGEERVVEIRPSNDNIELSYQGKPFGLIHDPHKARMVTDWQKKGLPCHAILLSNGTQVNLRFYRDKRLDNQFREQTVVALTSYKSDEKQEIIEFLENGDELLLESRDDIRFGEDYDEDDVVNIATSCGDEIGRLPKKIAAKYLEEGAYGAFYERGDEDDNGIITPVVRIFW